MPPAALPSNEAARLEALKRAEILDTPLEPQYDNLVNLAAFITKAPTALITIVDKDRNWFKARHNYADCQTDRDTSFCTHVVQSNETVLTLNAAEDHRFFDNPHVTGPDHVRFYAGAPIILPGTDYCLGTMCVVDTRPWPNFSAEALQALELLANQVAELIHLNLKLSTERRTLYNLVSKLSHELRTPINGLLGLTDDLMGTVPSGNKGLLHALRSISATARDNLHIVNSVVDYAATVPQR